jgi:ABC-2 type transport system permease protein
MRTIRIIIIREYLTRIKQRSFLVSTLAAPVGFALLMLITGALAGYTDGKKVISIIDEGNLLQHATLPDKSDKTLYFRYSDLSKESMIPKTFKDESDVFLFIPKQELPIEDLKELKLNYYGSKHLSRDEILYIQEHIGDKLRELKLRSLHLNADEIRNFEVRPKLSYISAEEGAEKEGALETASVIGFLTGIVIYATLIFYGVSIMRGVMEEKSSRIVEVIISSVRPFQLLMAKIIGIGLVGITQFFIWGVSVMLIQIVLLPILGMHAGSASPGMAAMQQGGGPDQQEMIEALINGMAQVNWLKMFGSFLFYFVGGYLLYGSLFAALGATINEEGETQSLSMIVTLPIVLSFIISIAVINDPFSQLAVWASIFPLSSPVVMPVRMAFDPPWYQVLISGILLIAGFVFSTWIAARIYRTGILMYGKKNSAKEIFRWLFYKG